MSAFLLLPQIDTLGRADLSGLSRIERMRRLREANSGLGRCIAERLKGWDIDYMEGTGSWTARIERPARRTEIAKLLSDLPVEVAPEDQFDAL